MNTSTITWIERRISPLELGVRSEKVAVKDAVAVCEAMYPSNGSQFVYDVIPIEGGRALKVEAALVPPELWDEFQEAFEAVKGKPGGLRERLEAYRKPEAEPVSSPADVTQSAEVANPTPDFETAPRPTVKKPAKRRKAKAHA